MSDAPEGPGWYKAVDDKWYPPAPAGDQKYLPPPKDKKAAGCLKWILGLLVLIVLLFAILVGTFLIFGDRNSIVGNTSVAPGLNIPKSIDVGAKVTPAEYAKILTGMTYEQVKEVVGGDSQDHSTETTNGTKIDTYSWAGDGNGDTVTLTFHDDKLYAKRQTGLGNG